MGEAADMRRYAERFGHTLQTIRKRMLQDFTALNDIQLTPPQFQILVMIGDKGPCKVTALAELMGVKPSAITVMTDKLVAQGYVSRKHQEDDRRVVMLNTTDSGRETVNSLKGAINDIIARYFSACSLEEIGDMVHTMEKIAVETERASHSGGSQI